MWVGGEEVNAHAHCVITCTNIIRVSQIKRDFGSVHVTNELCLKSDSLLMSSDSGSDRCHLHLIYFSCSEGKCIDVFRIECCVKVFLSHLTINGDLWPDHSIFIGIL
jgi:hypothetical protein